MLKCLLKEESTILLIYGIYINYSNLLKYSIFIEPSLIKYIDIVGSAAINERNSDRRVYTILACYDTGLLDK